MKNVKLAVLILAIICFNFPVLAINDSALITINVLPSREITMDDINIDINDADQRNGTLVISNGLRVKFRTNDLDGFTAGSAIMTISTDRLLEHCAIRTLNSTYEGVGDAVLKVHDGGIGAEGLEILTYVSGKAIDAYSNGKGLKSDLELDWVNPIPKGNYSYRVVATLTDMGH